MIEKLEVALDLETIPDLSKVDILPDPKAAANIKDPAKIEADIEKKKKAAIISMGLSPFTGRICAFAAVNEDENLEKSGVITSVNDDQERALIDQIFEAILSSNSVPQTVVTFNGMSFDFPFLYIRRMLLGMDPHTYTLDFWSKRYSSRPHYDMMMKLCGWYAPNAKSLDFYIRTALGYAKDELGYDKYIGLIESGEGDQIRQECLQHTHSTWKLFKKVKPFLG